MSSFISTVETSKNFISRNQVLYSLYIIKVIDYANLYITYINLYIKIAARRRSC